MQLRNLRPQFINYPPSWFSWPIPGFALAVETMETGYPAHKMNYRPYDLNDTITASLSFLSILSRYPCRNDEFPFFFQRVLLRLNFTDLSRSHYRIIYPQLRSILTYISCFPINCLAIPLSVDIFLMVVITLPYFITEPEYRPRRWLHFALRKTKNMC